MVLIINPGSGAVPLAGEGWTNTYGVALEEAERWLGRMREDGIEDVTLDVRDQTEREGRWTFGFRHSVTGVVVDLVTHGIDDMKAYEADGHIFGARVYWHGSSSSNPELEDWSADGFVAVRTFRPALKEAA